MFYNGKKLLNMKDLNGDKPEIYICTGNKTAGKTVFFNRKCVQDYLDYGHQFGLIYRKQNEMSDPARTFFNDIGPLFFEGHQMDTVGHARGAFKELLLDGQTCGFAMCLSSVDIIKRNSHMFNKINQIVFDEFQSEGDNYLDREVSKFIALHVAVARGGGQHVRRVPVYLISNCSSLINPYYTKLGISNRLKANTKFLKGNGWCLEQTFNTEASEALKKSQFMQAFEGSRDVAYAAENVYLMDNVAFIARMKGRGKYVCSVYSKDGKFNIKRYAETGLVYCDRGCDDTFPVAVAVDLESHNELTQLNKSSLLIVQLREYFKTGRFRFRDQECKQAVLELLSY